MVNKRTRAIWGRILGLGLMASSLWACSAKSSSVGTIRSSKNGADEEVDSGRPKGGTGSGNSQAEGGSNSEGEDEAETGPDLAQNDMPPGTMEPSEPDEVITVPINQTGAPGSEKENDPNQIVLNGNYFIKSAGGMKCLAVPNDSKDNGVQIHQKSCDLKSNVMKFEIEYLPSQMAYVISNVANQKFLEVRNQSEVIQGAVQQNDYFGLPHQMFLIEKKEDNRYYIRTKTKKLFFDVTGASVADNALIQLWGDGNGISSVWILEPTL